MSRYDFLNTSDIYDALNRLRDSFLAAKDGKEVELIINGLLTTDEKLKIGRRILIAESLRVGSTLDEVSKQLRVGKNTIAAVNKNLMQSPECFELLFKRRKEVEKVYQQQKYKETGSSKMVLKTKIYTGFKRKDVKR